MGFIPYKVDGSNRPQSLDYLPAAAITPKVGTALVFSSGKLTTATGNAKPEYISMTERSAALTAGDIIPVLKVNPDMIFAVPTKDNNSSTNLGTMLQIHTDGAQILDDTSGKCELVGKGPGGGAANDIVYVRIP